MKPIFTRRLSRVQCARWAGAVAVSLLLASCGTTPHNGIAEPSASPTNHPTQGKQPSGPIRVEVTKPVPVQVASEKPLPLKLEKPEALELRLEEPKPLKLNLLEPAKPLVIEVKEGKEPLRMRLDGPEKSLQLKEPEQPIRLRLDDNTKPLRVIMEPGSLVVTSVVHVNASAAPVGTAPAQVVITNVIRVEGCCQTGKPCECKEGRPNGEGRGNGNRSGLLPQGKMTP